MYSRSYGTIESADKMSQSFTIPQDYHGSFYRRSEPPASEISAPSASEPPSKETAPSKTQADPIRKEEPPARTVGGFLERLTAEDILLFVFLFSLLREEESESGSILGLILALLLL